MKLRLGFILATLLTVALFAIGFALAFGAVEIRTVSLKYTVSAVFALAVWAAGVMVRSADTLLRGSE